jgi:murein DD-endopeptidase MepM/ murein hydrolase activator NlpD
MPSLDTDRRALLTSVLGASLAAGWATAMGNGATKQAPGWRLVQRPARVFKAIDLPREGTEAWFLVLILEGETEGEPRIAGLEFTLFAGANEVKNEHHGAASAEAMVFRGLPSSGGVYRPLGLRLVCRERTALSVDRMRCTLTLDGLGVVSADVALGGYTQQTELIFPFRGPGIVTQGGAANGGHRNGSGAFAVDAMALAPNYAVQTGEAFAVNTDLAGYGRPLIAPAAGVVVHARGDRPDQPTPGESNEDYHAPEHRGSGDPGNHVVIDHGNGEFSMIAHLMAGSLAVSQGQQVAQGAPIGRLGNSGDSFAPHVHYQLQDGPSWQGASGLPCRFSNVEAQRLERGEFFSAR